MKVLIALMLLSGSVFAADIYGIKDKTIEGKEWSTDELKGKVALIVNIASQCGYTSQLEGLEALYQKYKAQNFVVLGVPTNDYGGQTPESDEGMKEFCQKNYKASFPILTKKSILGKEKRELYEFLTEKTEKKFQAEVGWNFEKFLINRKGEVVGRFKSSTKPEDLHRDIEKVLK